MEYELKIKILSGVGIPFACDARDESVRLMEIDGSYTPVTDTQMNDYLIQYQAIQYKGQRKAAYPSLAEQADMAYWDRQNGTTTLDDAISAVKLQFPKG